MAKKFRFNRDTPKVVISQDKKVPEPIQQPTQQQQETTTQQEQPPVTQQPEPLYCIEENVTTGWEVLETNLNRTNCESKFKWYAEQLCLSPQSIRIRRIR